MCFSSGGAVGLGWHADDRLATVESPYAFWIAFVA